MLFSTATTFASYLIAALAVSSVTTAAPTSDTSTLEKRSSHNYMFFCKHTLGWRGLPWTKQCSKRYSTNPGDGNPLNEYYDEPLKLKTCYNLGEFNDVISGYEVHNLCCGFYRHHSCKDRLFTAEDRSDNLDHGGSKKHNDEISSFKCVPKGQCHSL